MSYTGEPSPQFIDSRDGFHLSSNGISVLASNICDMIDYALNLPKHTPICKMPRFRENRGYRGRGRGSRREY